MLMLPLASKKLDTKEIAAKWTPVLERVRRGSQKICGLADGNIRGGYWVLNKQGSSATIAFLFKTVPVVFTA